MVSSHVERASSYFLFLSSDWDLTLVSESTIMATNKERIGLLEVSVGGLQDNMRRMELGVNNKLH